MAIDTDEITKFYEAHKNLDIDYFNFRPMESTNHTYYDNNDVEKIISHLNTLKHHDNRVIINYKFYETKTCFERCYANFSQIALNEKGEVIYCCHKPYEVTGHITDKDIWDKIKESKTNMSMCDVPCRLTGPNKIMKQLEKGVINSEFI